MSVALNRRSFTDLVLIIDKDGLFNGPRGAINDCFAVILSDDFNSRLNPPFLHQSFIAILFLAENLFTRNLTP